MAQCPGKSIYFRQSIGKTKSCYDVEIQHLILLDTLNPVGEVDSHRKIFLF